MQEIKHIIDMTVGGQTNKQPTFTVDSDTEKVTSNQDITKATPKEFSDCEPAVDIVHAPVIANGGVKVTPDDERGSNASVSSKGDEDITNMTACNPTEVIYIRGCTRTADDNVKIESLNTTTDQIDGTQCEAAPTCVKDDKESVRYSPV